MAIEDAGDPEYLKWRDRIIAAEKDREPWFKRVDGIIKRFKDERVAVDKDSRKFNMLWANIQTLRPALYGKQPTTLIERRFLDRDDVGRIASTIWERTIRYDLDDSTFHRSTKRSVLDYLLSGQGVLFVRYEADTADLPVESPDSDDDTDEDGTGNASPDDESDIDGEEPATEPQLLSQKICFDQINYKDFLTSKARTWDEVDWISKRVYLDKAAASKRFGKKRVSNLNFSTAAPTDSAKERPSANNKIAVYEIWDKPSKKVYWLTKDDDALLDQKPDPIQVCNFWPCAEPLLATTANDSVIPVPDYIEYQDQAQEIDDLTDRIDSLTSALKVAGVYDEAAGGLQRLLSEDVENQLIPVKNFSQFSTGGGGMQGVIAFLPVKEIADTLSTLISIREQMKKDAYEITGMSDIIRGQSDPDETLGAQQMKGASHNVRLQDRQRDVARWARDTIAIAGEIIAEQYSPETLIEKSGALFDTGIVNIPDSLPMPPAMVAQWQQQQAMMAAQQQTPQQPGAPAPQGPPATPLGAPASPPTIPMTPQLAEQYKVDKLLEGINLLKNDKLRGFRIDIETDSTIEGDAAEEKQSRVEFLTATTSFLKQAGEMAQQHPEIVPLLGKMLLFGVRGYRIGRDLESSIESFIEQQETLVKAKAAQPPQPNPDQVKAEAEIAKANTEAQTAQTTGQLDLASQQEDQKTKMLEYQLKQQQLSQQMELENQKHQNSMAEIALKNMGNAQPMDQFGATPQTFVPSNVG